MSLKALSWAKEFRTGSPTKKLVLLAIADYADEHGICWPAQSTIARQTELSERSVRRHLDQMEDAGVLRRHSRPPLPNGHRQSDLITLIMQPPDTVAAGSATGHSVKSHRTACPKPPDTVAAKPSIEPLEEPSQTPSQGTATSQGRWIRARGASFGDDAFEEARQ